MQGNEVLWTNSPYYSLLNGQTPSGKTIFIGKNLVFDDHFVFIGVNVVFAPGVYIKVNPGITLGVINSNLYSCTTAWTGIKNNGSLKILNSRIEDALIAVQMNNGSLNGIVQNWFNLNAVGLANDNDPNFELYTFNDNLFSADGALIAMGNLTPHPEAPIGVNLVSCQVNLNSIGMPVNIFKFLKHGMHLNNGNYYVYESRFWNNINGITSMRNKGMLYVQGSSAGTPQTLLQWDFSQNRVGINAFNSILQVEQTDFYTSLPDAILINSEKNHGIYEIQLTNNKFRMDFAPLYAINLERNTGWGGTLIKDNTFFSNNTSTKRRVVNIRGNSILPGQAVCHVNHNDFECRSWNGTTDGDAVIYITSNFDDNYIIENNSITCPQGNGKPGYAIAIDGNTGGAQVVRNNYIKGHNLDIICGYHQGFDQSGTVVCSNFLEQSIQGTHFSPGSTNEFFNLEQNLFHTHTIDTRIGYSDNPNADTWIGTQRCRDNVWTNEPQNGSQILCDNAGTTNNNFFFVRSNSNSIFFSPANYFPNNQTPITVPAWVRTDDTCNGSNMLDCQQFNFYLVNLTGGFWSSMSLPLPSDINTNALRWEKAAGQYRLIKENEAAFIGNTLVQNWIQAINTYTLIDEVYQSNSAIQQVNLYSTTIQSTLNGLRSQMQTLIVALRNLESQYQTSPSNALLTSMLQIHVSLALIASQISTIENNQDQQRNTVLTQQLQNWNNITGNSTLEQDYITIKKACLERLLSPLQNYAPNNYNIIKTIAQKCYTKAGHAAAWGRTFLSANDLVGITHDELRNDCGEVQQLFNNDRADNYIQNINIKPNPAHSFITIEFPQSNETYQWKLINAIGLVCMEGTGLGKIQEIELNRILPGMYFFQCVNLVSGVTTLTQIIKE